jgi:hypothetical protein
VSSRVRSACSCRSSCSRSSTRCSVAPSRIRRSRIVDRTANNPNLLWWHGRLWLIDHGAALYFHHAAARDPAHARLRFPQIAEHVLLPYASSIEAADERLAHRVTAELLEDVVAVVPDEWLDGDRRRYVEYLSERLTEPREFVAEAEQARGR